MLPRLVLFLVLSGACVALRCAFSIAKYRPVARSLGRHRSQALPRVTATNSDAHALHADILVHSTPEGTSLLTSDLDKWGSLTKEYADKVRGFLTKTETLEAYNNMLSTLATNVLDPLQITSFEIVTNAVVDSLIQSFPKDTPVTSLIEELTDLHHSIIADIFERKESGDEAEDLSTKADRMQHLAYQFAGLAQYTYTRIGLSLGEAFDATANAQELRRNVWLAPVLSRLQRACVMFSASEAEERIEEQRTQAFNSLLKRIHFQINPKYTLQQGHSAASMSSSLPAWELAHFVQKVLRNSVLGMDLAELEQKVLPVLREAIAERMRGLMRPLEQITMQRTAGSHGATAQAELQAIEQLLNLGHDSVAAVLVLWHVRHNIVGLVPPPDATASIASGRMGGQVRVKDYLRPITLRSVLDGSPVKPSALLESVPAHMREDVAFTVSEASQRLPTVGQSAQSATALYNIALLAEAVRRTAGEEFHALSTYNMDTDQLPAVSRDDMYVTVLATVLAHYLRSEHVSDEVLYEHLLAFAALEETWGVREPRASAAAALRLTLADIATDVVDGRVQAVGVTGKIAVLEHALGLVLRLPEGEGEKCRLLALETIFDHLFPQSERAARPGAEAVAAKQQPKWPVNSAVEAARQAAAVLGVEPARAERLLQPRKLAIFDRAVQELLMNADVAVSMPALSEVFESQVYAAAEGLGMTSAEAARRAAQLASAALAAFLVSVARDAAKIGATKVDVTLTKCMYISEHPFWSRMPPTSSVGNGPEQVLERAVEATVAKLGRAAALELIRALDAARIRATAAEGATGARRTDDTGWGRQDGAPERSAAAHSSALAAFIQTVQRAMLNEYSVHNGSR